MYKDVLLKQSNQISLLCLTHFMIPSGTGDEKVHSSINPSERSLVQSPSNLSAIYMNEIQNINEHFYFSMFVDGLKPQVLEMGLENVSPISGL